MLPTRTHDSLIADRVQTSNSAILAKCDTERLGRARRWRGSTGGEGAAAGAADAASVGDGRARAAATRAPNSLGRHAEPAAPLGRRSGSTFRSSRARRCVPGGRSSSWRVRDDACRHPPAGVSILVIAAPQRGSDGLRRAEDRLRRRLAAPATRRARCERRSAPGAAPPAHAAVWNRRRSRARTDGARVCSGGCVGAHFRRVNGSQRANTAHRTCPGVAASDRTYLDLKFIGGARLNRSSA